MTIPSLEEISEYNDGADVDMPVVKDLCTHIVALERRIHALENPHEETVEWVLDFARRHGLVKESK